MKVEFDKIYYLTQYADYLSDEGVLEMFQEHVDGMEEDIAEKYLEDLYKISQELMPYIQDNINERVYEILTHTEDLSRLSELMEAIKDDDFDKINELTGYGIDDFMAENEIYTPDLWADFADEDLRNNGIDASALYWVNEIDYGYDYLGMNGYANGFNFLDKNDLLEEYIEEHIDFTDFI